MIDYMNCNNCLNYDSYFNQENSPSNGIENVSIIIQKNILKKRKKRKEFKYTQQPTVIVRLSNSSISCSQKEIPRRFSMPEINGYTKLLQSHTISSHATINYQQPFKSKFIVNKVSEHHFDELLNPFYYPTQTKFKVYRCQLNATEDTCCCSCNSDAMFEVMKSLYDCYKKKNCDNCNCILCGHLQREERLQGEIRKSLEAAGLDTASVKDRKEKMRIAEKLLEGKSPEQKEKLLREMGKTRQPLPEGKTASEKELIKKIRNDLGLPPEPKTAEEKANMRKAEASGIITPLEGKTLAQKEKILRAQADLGIPLPEGRTASEKTLIQKIKAGAKEPKGIPSEKLRKARAAGLITPLEGKTPEQKEKILKGLAMNGIPLPEGKTQSEKKLITKVRADLGLPPEPKTKGLRDRYAHAANAGLMQPLEGKSPKEKEKILQGLADVGLPLPEGRTPSEKLLVAKVKARAGPPLDVVAPSEKMRRAKAAGFLTPLAGKPPDQREKILRGLAMQGIPLPEGQTPSEKKLIDKVRMDLGLPPEPKSKSIRDKHGQAANVGLLLPLEGKTQPQKEKILQGLHDMGIPLPVGRTPSEKALVTRIMAMAGPRALSEVLPITEKMRKAKAAGLLTPLAGKPPDQKEKILRGFAMQGIPLPEGQTPSEKKLIDKVRMDLGLPPEPKSKSIRDKHGQAANNGVLLPLEGQTLPQKEKILQGLHDIGIPLPVGRTPSEKALIAKIMAGPRAPSEVLPLSEKMRKAKAAGLLTPLTGKTPDQREKILKALAMQGIPLPEGQTPSEKKLIDKVRMDLGLPPEPKSKSIRDKHGQAANSGVLLPLEGKTPPQKEKILRGLHDMGIPLPVGRTPSEKSLIAKIMAGTRAPSEVLALSEKMRKAKAAGLLTPLTGKTPDQRDKILRALAMQGIPLPEGQTPSEKKLIDKVRMDLGLPPEPKSKSIRDKHGQAANSGVLLPLEGKTPPQKEKILRGLHDMGIPLPVGRTPSEKSLIAKIMAGPRAPSEVLALSEKMRKAKAAGLLTPLTGKTPDQREKILKALAMQGIPLPEGQTPSEKKLIDKVRMDLGLPPEPKTKSIRDKHGQAANVGVLLPLEGKTLPQKEKILRGLHDMGIPLPVGRTPSEKSLIAKIMAGARALSEVLPSSEKMRKAKAAGLLTPLTGKTPDQREKILRGLAMQGIPLPESHTPSEKKVIDKVRMDLGLPPEPKTKSIRDKHGQAANVGALLPLEGKTQPQKEKILRGLHDMGIPLPVGRTPSEKALIAKIIAGPRASSEVLPLSEKLRKAKAAGLLTPLTGKTPDQREKILKTLAMQGIPLPEGQTPSEKKLIDKVRMDLGLPPEPKSKSIRDKHGQAANVGVLLPLEGKTPPQKENILRGLHDIGIPLPVGRTPSEKSLIAKIMAGPRAPSEVLPISEKMRKAKAAGLLTPLTGKTPDQREKILKALAMQGIPLPEGQTPSEKKLIDKVRMDFGLPPEPKTKSIRDKHGQAANVGVLLPLEGKTPPQKEKILRGLHDMGIPLPVGRTPSEKSLIAKIMAGARAPSEVLALSEKMRKAKAAGLLTPLTGKTPDQREKILKALAMQGIPLPEGQTSSEKKLIDKVRMDLGLPPEPKSKSIRDKHGQAANVGVLLPLEGKTPPQKENILRGLHDMGIPLPVGRTPSEKSLIAKIMAGPRAPSEVLPISEKMRKAKAAGLLTPLTGKTPDQREKILRALAMQGIPLPEGHTPSEKKLIDKVRMDLGLPPEPKTKSIRDKHGQAANVGALLPLEGKTPPQKEKILRGLHDMGIPLPVGRTPSEKSLIAKIMAGARALSEVLALSEKMRKAKAAGLLTPLIGKTPDQRERILRALAMQGIPLPEGQTPSEKKLIDKVRMDLGLPPEPKSKSIRDKHGQAANVGVLLPLEGKTPPQKENILRGLHDMGIPLPVGRTPSEKSLIAKIMAGARAASEVLPISEKMRKAKAAGLLTPLTGKTPDQRERILRALAMQGIPLPEGQTPSEKKLIDKVRMDLALPPEPKTKSIRDKHGQAANVGVLLPLEGKTPPQKEKILQGLHDLGIPLPVGRTPSEKALIAKIMAVPRALSAVLAPSEKMRKAKAEGLLTPLKGKTPAQKEKILKGLANYGIPFPEGQTPSDKKFFDKVRTDIGLPPEPKTSDMRAKYAKAADAGFLQPLEGKTPAQKEKILQGLHDMGITLPDGRTSSEKSLVAKVKARPRLALPSEKLRKAKAEGLLSPLKGKTPEQKEKILRDLVKQSIPLPEGQTPSDKKLIGKIRADVGLPPEPKTPSIKEKYAKALAAGLITPLEGKTPVQKEKILRGQAAMGLPLPEGRTPSEKALITKIKAVPIPSITTDKYRKAKAAGLLTPLADKTPEQREKILKGLAKAGLPLPDAKTSSEKALINQVKKEFGIPDQTPSEKLRKAKAAGLLTPLEDKAPAQREKILRGRAAAGLPLPEGKSPSERALIQKIKDDTGFVTPSPSERLRKAKAAGLLTPLKGKSLPAKEKILKDMLAAGVPIPEGETPSEKALISKLAAGPPPTKKSRSEKLKQAKAAGLLTPLKGKTPDQKQKILRGLVAAGLPLPEPKTDSEKDLINKIREEAGLPPEPKTPSLKEKYKKALAAGLITPLEGKTPAEKEKTLKRLHDAGIPLPEGRTSSEKAMVKRIKGPVPERRTLSEKLKAAKAAGFLSPLSGKTPAQKEKILRGLAKTGVPLPEGKTPSDKDLINKVRNELGLPPEPITPLLREKMQKAQAAGIITPLEGKTPAQKQNILKALAEAGLPLPEGRTPSEKALIAKLKAESKARKSPSEKIRKAKADGLITPLEGKSPGEKERIMKGLAEHGLPLPEAKTSSEKKLAAKVRKELGLPPAPTTPSMKERHEKAAAAGVLVPLEGLSPAEKKKLLKAQADLGLSLPEGRTSSEKSLIAKVKLPRGPSKTSSEKMRKAKTAGLLTPLEGKTPAEKEKIIKGLAEAGLPLPEGKTSSDKSLIHKVRTDLGIPPTAKTASEKSVIRKAKADGLFTPITNKSPAEKERILKGLAEAGLPLPIGQTPSDKELIKKVRAEAGLAAEPTASEKMGKIKKKSKKVGVGELKRIGTGIGAAEFEDIIKTTTCDRGCGCDKKKIRFKHSYVKIRVTSPDISSLCSCPEECIPGVKNGAFIDNEGIKVTVGRVIGIPSYPKVTPSSGHSNTYKDFLPNRFNSTPKMYKMRDRETYYSNSNENYTVNTSSSGISDSSTRPYDTESDNNYLQRSTPPYEGRASNSVRIVESSRDFESLDDIYKDPTLDCKSIHSSFDSILVIKSETSLSLTTSASSSSDTISVMSDEDSSVSSYSTNDCQLSGELLSSHLIDRRAGTIVSERDDPINKPTWTYLDACKKTRNIAPMCTNVRQTEYMTFRMAETKQCSPYNNKNCQLFKKSDPVVVLSQVTKKLDLAKMVDKILAKKQFSDASSIFIVVPTSDNDAENSSNGSINSINNSIKSVENVNEDKPISAELGLSSSVKRVKCGRGKKFYMQEISMLSIRDKETETVFNNEPLKVFTQKEMKHKICQITTPNNLVKTLAPNCHAISTDTTVDRPCCCRLKKSGSAITTKNSNSKEQYVANVVSRQINPLFLKQGLSHLFKYPAFSWLPQRSRSSMKSKPTVTRCHVPPCPKYCGNREPDHTHRQENLQESPVPLPKQKGKKHKIHTIGQRCPPNKKILKNAKIKKKSIGSSCAERTPTLPIARKGDCDICTNQNDLEEPNTPVKLKKKCPCEEHYSVSHKEGGPKTGTRSMGIVTELKAPQILADQAAKQAPAVPVSSGNKKPRFCDLPAKSKTSNTKNICKEVGPSLKSRLTHSITKLLSRLSLRTVADQLKTNSSGSDYCKELLAKGKTVGHSGSNKPIIKDSLPSPKPKTETTRPEPINLTTSKELIKQVTGEPTQKVSGENQEVHKKSSKTCKTETGICKCHEPTTETSTRSTSDEKFPPVIQGVEPGVPTNLQAIPETEYGITEVPYNRHRPSCGWRDTGALMKMRSEMSVLTSGFKLYQKKKQREMINAEEAEIELDFEDAIRYFATMNPVKIREIINLKHEHKALQADEDDEEVKQSEEKNENNCRKNKKNKKVRVKEEQKKKGKCNTEARDLTDNSENNINSQDSTKDSKQELISQDLTEHKKKIFSQDWMEHSKIKIICQDQVKPPCKYPYGPIVPPIINDTETESSGEMEPCQGFKFTVCAKGADSPGLTGIICYDMVRESYTSW